MEERKKKASKKKTKKSKKESSSKQQIHVAPDLAVGSVDTKSKKKSSKKKDTKTKKKNKEDEIDGSFHRVSMDGSIDSSDDEMFLRRRKNSSLDSIPLTEQVLDQKNNKNKNRKEKRGPYSKASSSDDGLSVETDSTIVASVPSTNETNGRYQFLHNGSPIYEWQQTLDTVSIYLIPPPAMGHLIVVEMTPKQLNIGMKNGKAWFIDEATFGEINVSESSWKLDDDEYKRGGKVVAIHMRKKKRGELWETALLGKLQSRHEMILLDEEGKERMRKDMLAAEEEAKEQKHKKQASLRAAWQFRDDINKGEVADKRRAARAKARKMANESGRIEELKPLTSEEKAHVLNLAREYLSADIRLFSSCQDDQQAQDNSNVQEKVGFVQSKGEDGGVCTSVMLKFLYEVSTMSEGGKRKKKGGKGKKNGKKKAPDALTYASLLQSMRNELNNLGYQQAPVLTASRPVSVKDEFKIVPDNFSGQRKALIIAINYAPDTPFYIPGCQNDAWNTIQYLKTCQGFQDEDITVLIDDDSGEYTPPTRENILRAFHRFAFSVEPGDAAFLYYAGHGKSMKNAGMDDYTAEFDQVMMPMDFLEEGGIVDDEIFRVLLVPLKEGVRVTAIVDCCHSGSIFDLPFEYVDGIEDSSKDNGGVQESEDFRAVRFPHMDLVRHERKRIEAITTNRARRPSTIENIMVRPPTKKKKRSTPGRRKGNDFNSNRSSNDSIDMEIENKYMEMAAVETLAELERKQELEDRRTFMIGCLMLLLNPIKLCRVLLCYRGRP